jgi:hypothetical protein
MRAGLAVALFAAAVVVVTPAAPAYAAVCAADAPGVTMVVDFAALGGGAQTSCAGGDPATGVAALEGAGFTVTGTARWGKAFVCRISGKPTAAAEPCVDTPPASAYWSYWHAQPGGSWSYSQLGALAYNPAPGTVEGWAFGSGAPPGIAPPRLVAPPAPPPPPAPPAPVPTPAQTTGRPGSGSTTGGNGPVATVAASPRPGGGTAPTSPAITAAPGATEPVGAPRTTDPPPVADDTTTGSGGQLSTVVGIAIVAALGAAAAVVAWRRRRSSVTEPATEEAPDID